MKMVNAMAAHWFLQELHQLHVPEELLGRQGEPMMFADGNEEFSQTLSAVCAHCSAVGEESCGS